MFQEESFMDNSPDISSAMINGDKEKVWNAMTNEDMLIQWYAPGSPWKHTEPKGRGESIFTLMPNAHNNLKEEYPMSKT